MSALLAIEELHVDLRSDGALGPVLNDVSLGIAAGESFGLVGESGSGKSMTVRSIARLLPTGARVRGAIRFDGEDVLSLRRDALRRYRSRDIAIIAQDPRAAVNPVHTIGHHLTEPLRRNLGVTQAAAERTVIDLLAEMGIDHGSRRLRQYPHELSGGLLQRVVIAGALATNPRLLLADEPTTALDATTQSEIMAILDELRRERGLALLFITHDLDLAAAVCDRIGVMYAGQLVEVQPAASIHDDPLHPYTAALGAARPSLDGARRLVAIPGQPVSAFEAPAGCSFAPRCAHAADACRAEEPVLREIDHGLVRCVRATELRGRLLAGATEELNTHG